MGNSKYLLLLALAIIIGSTGRQNSLQDALDVYNLDAATLNSKFPKLDNVNPWGRSATGTTRRPKAAGVDKNFEYWRNYQKEKSGLAEAPNSRKLLPPSPSAAELENERLQILISELEKERQSNPKQVAKRPSSKEVSTT